MASFRFFVRTLATGVVVLAASLGSLRAGAAEEAESDVHQKNSENVEITPTKRTKGSESLVFKSSSDTMAYYRDLLERYRKGKEITLEDFNRTFKPVESAPPVTQELFVRCTNHPMSEDCYTDTYYSWGNVEKMKAIADRTPDGTKWTERLNTGYRIYVTPSSIATYCYGRLPVRFRFRKGQHPGSASSAWTLRDLADYFIDPPDSGKVESVSYGQPEQFDEMITELQRRLARSQPWKDTQLYRRGDLNTYQSPKKDLLRSCVPERGLPLEESELVQNLVGSLETVLDRSGWIHTQSCDGCAAANHFKTDHPTFFNPN